MASRRMISTTVFSSDKFMDMQPVTQLLYLQIGLNADDDGFTNRINAIRRMVGATQENVNELVDAGFIYIFDSGVTVDMLWNVNNSVRKDRYHQTVYQEEYALLTVDTDGRYLLKPSDNQMDTSGIPSDNQMDTEVRLGKFRLGNNIPSNKQSTSSLDIAETVDNPVDNSDNVGNAEPDPDNERPASLDGMDLYLMESPAAFNLFRTEYPRRQGALRDVQVAWVTAVAGGASPGDLVMAARKYAAECKTEKTEQKYIAMPQNFLKDKWRTYIPKYSPGCTKCHGKGVYEDGDRMIMCNCDRRYG